MHELFGAEFVDGVIDDAPVAQIDASLGETNDRRRDLNSFVIEGATQSGQVRCHDIDDRADRCGRWRSAAASAPPRQVAMH